MFRYQKDEIKFHNFLIAARQLKDVTLDEICEGLCSSSAMQRIESGDRLPDKLMRDRLLSRMGIASEGYEDYLAQDEYEEWVLRQNIVRCIEKKSVTEAEAYLKEYKKKKGKNAVEQQYCEAMQSMILEQKGASKEQRLAVIERAAALTIPDIKIISDNALRSEQEENLLIEYVSLYEHSRIPEENVIWQVQQYEKILERITNSKMNILGQAKVYTKAACYMCRLILNHLKTGETLKKGLKYCDRAVEILRDSRKMYYLVELLEVWQTLANELQFILRRDAKRTEAEKLCAMIAEKKEWCELLKGLYEEYGMSPYMENFCYLYHETEVYCIGDVVKARREMLGMTKEQLCEGICSLKTITRIEHKRVKTQMPIVRELFERLGLCAEYKRARVITSKYEVLQLAEKLVWYKNTYKLDEWEECLQQLEKELCMEIPQNKQFIMFSRYRLMLNQKQMSKEEWLDKMKEVLEYTIPPEAAMRDGRKYLAREEIHFMYKLGIRLVETEENPYIDIVRETCEQYEQENSIEAHISRYEFLMTGLCSYLGNIGEYSISNKRCTRLMKESLFHRRMAYLAQNLYNNLWNEQQEHEQKEKGFDVIELKKVSDAKRDK